MEKINWINGQAGGTPLSAENLNQMQDNIEDAISELDKKNEGITLYENINGSNESSLELNQSISNFSEVKIDYVCGTENYNINESKRTPINSGNCVSLSCLIAHSDVVQLLDIGRYLFSGTSVTRVHETRTRILSSNAVSWDGTSSGIYITKITGYKF